MPLFEITESGLARHVPAGFKELGVYERGDLQRLLRADIGALGDNLLVIGEEFGEWEDARRRIDLLAIDRSGHLVVIELKRTEDGGHMELQALRYAAMVSSMSFDDVVNAYAGHLAKLRPEEDIDARAGLVSFLQTDGDAEPVIESEVRIILVSADFGRELTTTVLWLNRLEGMDITCIRLVPYALDGKVFLDIQQVVPLPEAVDYQVRVRRKEQDRQRARADNRDFTRYHVVVDGRVLPDENKRHAVRVMVQKLLERGVAATDIERVLGTRFLGVEGELEEESEIGRAFKEIRPHFDPRYWFIAYPFREKGRTWLLRRRWGRETESTLTELSASFPDARVSFRRADG